MLFASTLLCAAAAMTGVHASSISTRELLEKRTQGLRLLEFGLDEEPIWKTEEEKWELLAAGEHFIDVTATYNPDRVIATPFTVASYNAPSREVEVNPILDTVLVENLQTYLDTLSAFNNRYYQAQTGVDASNWILETVQGIIDDTGFNATASQFEHNFIQSSVIARIPGSQDGPLTVLGAHLDSVNSQNRVNGRAPGADDDGSGSVNLIEAFRALAEAGFAPSTPVEFQWYAGEEGGLLGSNDIAASYSDSSVEVQAALNLDMTAYFAPGSEEVVALLTDNVSAELSDFVKTLVDEYLTIPWVDSRPCGYGCSDHASWTRYGYPSAFPFEAPFGQHSPVIHTTGDTTTATGFSFDHSLHFSKLAVAFAYELAI